MVKYLIKYYLLLLIFFPGSLTPAQENNFLNKLDTSRKIARAQVVFNQIENAISSGNVSLLSNYLSSQTYLSLSNGIRGYYSSNQAFYIQIGRASCRERM